VKSSIVKILHPGPASRPREDYCHRPVGTDKRDRQKAGRQARAEAELVAARKAKRRRSIIRFVVSAAVVLGLLFGYTLLFGNDDSGDDGDSATSDTTTPGSQYSNPELADEVLARGAPDIEPPPADTPADALESETLIEGEGEGAAAGDTIVVHYIGNIPDGTVFDQSWERGEPFPVQLGAGSVITGWDEGLVGVKIGEQRRLVLGADNAYGDQANGDIPANSPLAFVVDVVDIQPGEGGAATTVPAAPATTAPAG
jgi:peptidylprolyl isomerase